jgi:hypothetical protein
LFCANQKAQGANDKDKDKTAGICLSVCTYVSGNISFTRVASSPAQGLRMCDCSQPHSDTQKPSETALLRSAFITFFLS